MSCNMKINTAIDIKLIANDIAEILLKLELNTIPMFIQLRTFWYVNCQNIGNQYNIKVFGIRITKGLK
jgi:hypothetical protein